MSASWKVFAVLNYIGAVANITLLAIIGTFAVENGLEAEDHSSFWPVVGSLILMLLNYVVNIMIYHRCFPDKPLSGGKKTLYIILTILFSLCVIGLLFLVTFGIIEESSPNPNDSKTGLVLLLLLVPLALTSVYTFVKQVTLLNFLRKNYKKKMLSDISAIGSGNQ